MGMFELTERAKDEWIGRVNAAWQKGIACLIEAGQLLNEAQEELPHGYFVAMLGEIEKDKQRLLVEERVARRLMKLAKMEVVMPEDVAAFMRSAGHV
jgi:hypothetical protein